MMADNDKKGDYPIGYKKPPHHTRFRTGVSGNPAGRSKGARSLKSDLLEELSEKIPVTERGMRRRLSKQRVTLKALVNKGMSGDVGAAAKVIDLSIRLLGLDEGTAGETALSTTDEKILAAFLERYADGRRR